LNGVALGEDDTQGERIAEPESAHRLRRGDRVDHAAALERALELMPERTLQGHERMFAQTAVVLASPAEGKEPGMRRPSLLFVVYVVVGVIVAASYSYFDNLKTTGRVLTLIAAILMWPILLFGFDIRIHK
jgi:hypothetical protein